MCNGPTLAAAGRWIGLARRSRSWRGASTKGEIDWGRKALALREGSLPPPKTGVVTRAAFPAEDALPPRVVEAGPLRVLKHSPEGAVEVAPSLQVTFSQPMVALTSVEDVGKVPVEISPRPEGIWRWLGVDTAAYTPTGGRFPMSSEIRVEVPAGTRSQSGGKLASPLSWSFQTPTVQAKLVAPQSNAWSSQEATSLRPVLLLECNQRVDRTTCWRR